MLGDVKAAQCSRDVECLTGLKTQMWFHLCHFVLVDSNHAEICLDVVWFILNYVAFLCKEMVFNQFEYLEGHDEVRVWTMQTSGL